MRKILLFLLSLAIPLACSKEEISKEELALQTAKTYYEQLLNGDVASFVSGMNVKDSIVPSYREQLETNMLMFLGQQQTEHKGISSVTAVKAEKEIDSDVIYAFLLLCYGDSTREQVVIPMVEHDGVWMMK